MCSVKAEAVSVTKETSIKMLVCSFEINIILQTEGGDPFRMENNLISILDF